MASSRLPVASPFTINSSGKLTLLRLQSKDDTNRLSISTVRALTREIEGLAEAGQPKPLIITGNSRYFSVGADLNEITKLEAPAALEFARAGQKLMQAIADYPSTVFPPIEGNISAGYCLRQSWLAGSGPSRYAL